MALRVLGFLPRVARLEEATAVLIRADVGHEFQLLACALHMCAYIIGTSLDDGHRFGQANARPGTCAKFFGFAARDNGGIFAVLVRLPYAHLITGRGRVSQGENIDCRNLRSLIYDKIFGREALHIVKRINAAEVQDIVFAKAGREVNTCETVAKGPAQRIGGRAILAQGRDALHVVARQLDDMCGHGRNVAVAVGGIYLIIEKAIVARRCVIVGQRTGCGNFLVVSVNRILLRALVSAVGGRSAPSELNTAAHGLSLEVARCGRNAQSGVLERDFAARFCYLRNREIRAATCARLGGGQRVVGELRLAA